MSRTDDELLESFTSVLRNRDGNGLSLRAQEQLLEMTKRARHQLFELDLLVFKPEERDWPKWTDRGLPNQLAVIQGRIEAGLGRPRT